MKNKCIECNKDIEKGYICDKCEEDYHNDLSEANIESMHSKLSGE